MIDNTWKKLRQFIVFCIAIMISVSTFGAKPQNMNSTISPTVVHQFFKEAKRNTYWKFAFLTGKKGQIVFMNISPNTNPKNEIGMERHSFDQIILVVEGNGKAILSGKTTEIKTGDMIFIPQGTMHNVINSNEARPLKIVSIYSDTDIPAHSKFEKKSDE